MSIRWDSLRSHNGCLSLFDLTDLTDKIRRLALKHEKERGEASTAAAAATDVVSPRTYRFKRVTPMELLRQQEERRRRQQQEQKVTASSARRVLLPAVQTEDEASVGADLEGRSRGRVLGGEGLVLFVDDDSKVRVMRDRRSKADLVAEFPDVAVAIVEEVWARTGVFAAASTILTSLRNSGHTELSHHLNIDLRLDDPSVWPTLEEVFGAEDAADAHHPLGASGASTASGSSGWERIDMSDGGSADQWVLVLDEEVGGLSLSAAAAEEEEEEEGGGGEAQAAPTGAGRMSYRAALTSNLMDGDEGATGVSPSARRFFPLAAVAAARRKRAKVAAAAAAAAEQAQEDDDWEGGGGGGGGFHEEYVLTKAVSVRTRKHCGRKRLTETGKIRMAAKAAKRLAAKQQAPGAGGDSEDEGGDAMEW